MARDDRLRLEAYARGAGTARRTAAYADPNRTRCEHKTETLRLGRNVADYRQCKRLATPGARYCWQHG